LRGILELTGQRFWKVASHSGRSAINDQLIPESLAK